jgi:hypothetical protein
MAITNIGKKQVLEALKNKITHFALGTALNSDSEFATSLGEEQFRKPVTDKIIIEETNSIDVECFVASAEGNGHDFSELGLLDSFSGGNLFVITNFPPETKTSLLEWLVDIEIEIK